MVKSIAKKRKWQFYGNKFTNTSKNNSTSAVPECTVSCWEIRVCQLQKKYLPGPVFGNRIVDLELIVEAFAQLCCPKCFAEKVELFEDSRYGLCSHFTLKCKGFAGAFKLCSTLNLHRLTKTDYKNQDAKLLKVVQEVAEKSMIKAASEIVEKKQNLSSDIVKCGISVDGTWQRRGYTSMNGCAAAISVDTGKVLDIEVIYAVLLSNICGDLRFLPVNFDKPWATTLHPTSVSTYHAKGTTCLLLKALIIIDKAWRALNPLTIHSWFKKSGSPSPNLVDVDDILTEFNAEPSLWEALPEQDLMFDDYMLVDTDIALWGALSDSEIVTLDHNNTKSDEYK
ncbi:uncharacterized protein TNCV_1776531 [Trichonephila clavipes]|nr:uncharacterized protein TNCV_1776531 [Trichonephila clavipes]